MANTKLVLNLVIVCICTSFTIACEDCSDLSGNEYTTVSYSSQDADVINPERGGAVVIESFADASLGSTSPLTKDSLDAVLSDYGTISLIWREYYLDFLSEIGDYKDVIQGDMDALRANGFKVIIRFAYTNNMDYTGTTEMELEDIINHITELTPILENNIDVILCVQMGFIGVYGQWYHTVQFGDYGIITDDEQADRDTVLTTMLAALPTSRSVQLRTPAYKVAFTGSTGPLTTADFESGATTSRIGHYSNCFLYNQTDAGTYSDIVVDYAYLQNETVFVPMGGETCGANAPRTECTTAEQELSRFHYTYLNIAGRNAAKAPDTAVIDSWKSGGCYDDILTKLGYHLRLVSAILPTTVLKQADACFSLTLTNDGYAAPIHSRVAKIILRLRVDPFTNYTTGEISEFNDARTWGPEDGDITITFSLKLTVPAGDYDVLLELGDPLLPGIPAYNILFLNKNVSEFETGLNNLGHVIKVEEESGAGTCDGMTEKTVTNSTSTARCLSGCSGLRYTSYTPSLETTTGNQAPPTLLISCLTLSSSLAATWWLG
ncbi:uncharacterized protein [Watersipora subatra]|uniref:uncharacterized protein n=1 Tax=Watersipora subatra TaxID=2589382 RepID=UPI00355B9C53